MTLHFVHLLDELRRRSLRMAGIVEDMLQESCEVLFQADEALARRVMSRDQEVDDEEIAVETEVIRLLALYQPVGSDLRLLATVLKVTNDLERVADCAVNVAERARHLEVQELASASEDLKQIVPRVRRALRNAIQAYASENAEGARQVIGDDAAIDALYGQIVRQVIATAPENPEKIALCSTCCRSPRTSNASPTTRRTSPKMSCSSRPARSSAIGRKPPGPS